MISCKKFSIIDNSEIVANQVSITYDLTNDKKPDTMISFRHQYRTSLGITFDILEACMDAGINGILVSSVSKGKSITQCRSR